MGEFFFSSKYVIFWRKEKKAHIWCGGEERRGEGTEKIRREIRGLGRPT